VQGPVLSVSGKGRKNSFLRESPGKPRPPPQGGVTTPPNGKNALLHFPETPPVRTGQEPYRGQRHLDENYIAGFPAVIHAPVIFPVFHFVADRFRFRDGIFPGQVFANKDFIG